MILLLVTTTTNNYDKLDYNKITQSMLSYWFHANKPLINLKQKWMISTENTKQLSKIDEEIYKSYYDILCTIWDYYNQYGDDYLEDIWYNNMCWERCVALIMLIDQFSRHAQRCHDTNVSNGNEKLKLPWNLNSLNKLAIKSSKHFTHKFNATLIQSGHASQHTC